MSQQAVLVFENLTDPDAEPIQAMLAEALTRVARPNPDDAAYFQARAEVEAVRAEEAAHPAARAAHLEMAELYRRRALAGRRIEGPADPDWMGEDGSLYLDA